MTMLILLRHGETAWNAERRLQGRHEVDLSTRGRQQVAGLAVPLATVAPTRVISSPLLRTLETARLLGFHDPILDARWQEADLGEWTGRTRSEIPPEDYAAWRAGRLTPPGAESFEDLRARVEEAITSLKTEERPLVVTHGGPIRAACDVLLGLGPETLVPAGNGALTVFDLSGVRPRLQGYNLRFRIEDPSAVLVEPPD
jgi:broad specificity phosphatase PhoE